MTTEQNAMPRGTHMDNLAADEIATPVMIYTLKTLSWGQFITKESLKPGLVLHSAAVPEYLSIYRAHTLNFLAGKLSKPTPLSELHIPLEQVIGFHLMPPHEQAPTYDPEAPNRKMEPVTIMVGPFHFNAVIRMATQTTLPKFLEVAKGDFLQVYEAEIIHPQNPDMQPIRVKTADVRRQQVAFAGRI